MVDSVDLAANSVAVVVAAVVVMIAVAVVDSEAAVVEAVAISVAANHTVDLKQPGTPHFAGARFSFSRKNFPGLDWAVLIRDMTLSRFLLLILPVALTSCVNLNPLGRDSTGPIPRPARSTPELEKKFAWGISTAATNTRIRM